MEIMRVSIVLLMLFAMPALGELRHGDIVFHESRTRQSKAVSEGTGSPITHMGIIYLKKGKPFVYEAVSPVTGRVGLTPYAQWVARGKDQRVWVKRLAEKVLKLTPERLRKLQKVGRRYLGKRYDRLFQWDDQKIYCSELVFDMYDKAFGIQLGQVQTVGDLNLSPDSVQRLIAERLGQKLKLDENIITPVSIFNDERLEAVYPQ